MTYDEQYTQCLRVSNVCHNYIPDYDYQMSICRITGMECKPSNCSKLFIVNYEIEAEN